MSQKQKPSLLVDFCSYEAAKWAVEHWHYSKVMPVGKLVRLGVWEDEGFIGAVIFARGNSPTSGKSYGLQQNQVCELARVALCSHYSLVTEIVSKAIKKLKRGNPDLRLIISFADPAQGHIGLIYQAGNWIYNGQSSDELQFFHDGKWKHRREVTSGAFGKNGALIGYKDFYKRIAVGKFRYLYPLDKAMRRQIEPLAKPYPKRAGVGEMESRKVSSLET